jgi:hypothetical protein
MKAKPKKERAVKLSVSLKPHHIAFIEANMPIFGTTSGCITRGLDELIARVAEEPDVYTIKPVIPKRADRPAK